MTNPTLNNEIGNTEVILWQYDKAWNLIHLIENWNKWAKGSCQDFWDRFMGDMGDFKDSGTFTIDCADTFGLNVWGNMLGIPRPTIKIETGSDSKMDTVTVPSSDGTVVEGYNKYGFNEEGYKVLEVGGNWKTVTITNDLYRRLLKARFFMMNHKPTVPNYNKFLAILWGAIDTEDSDSSGGNIEYDTKKIFDEDGNANADGSYTSRARVFDFQNMTMGFSFPLDATIEEAYLIFQHYDMVYPFPAGIRYPGEFILDDLVIGLNNTDADGQFYKNFVDGVVLAEDDGDDSEESSDDSEDAPNPNGGIFSTTDHANYYAPTQINGKAFVFEVDESNSSVSIAISGATNPNTTVWIDFGDGYAQYYKIVNSDRTIPHTYESAVSGSLVAVMVISNYNVGIDCNATQAKEYELRI